MKTFLSVCLWAGEALMRVIQTGRGLLTTYPSVSLGLTFAILTLLGLCYVLHRHRVRQLLTLERMRARIAMDLHDDIGANLSRIAMLSEVTQRECHSPEITARLARIASISRESVDSLSDIVWAINPAQDRLIDLTQRMRRLADDFCAARDLDFQFHADLREAECKLITDTRREVLLIFKECIHNIAKHSNCTSVNVQFQQQVACLQLVISDNGRGIDLQAMQNGNGLGSMRQRAQKLGGKLDIKSVNGYGTTITLQLPFRAEKDFWTRGRNYLAM